MVELKQNTTGNGATEDAVWVSAMRKAGLSEEEIDRVVSATTTATLERPTDRNGHGRELVTVKEAAARIGRSENTVRSWIRLGHLATVDLPPPPDHANGPWVHVDMAMAKELCQRPSQERGSALEPNESGLITLKEAAERFRITLGRLRTWVRRGHLKPRARRADGSILVKEKAVEELVKDPPRTGRPPKVTN